MQERERVDYQKKYSSLNKAHTLKEDYFKIYGYAGAFSNDSYLDFYLSNDFEDEFKKVTQNLDEESKKFYKWIFLRILFVRLICSDTLFLEEELYEQDKIWDLLNISSPSEISEFKFTGEFNLHPFVSLNYTDEDKEFLKNKDIIDAGAFTGDTSLPLSKLTNKNVFAFEPFEKSFELLNKNIKDNNIENIIPINKSLGDIIGDRILFLKGDNYQGITNDAQIREFDSQFSVDEITVDEFVERNNLDIGLISVDVEGMEMNLLKGAINTIKKHKPILEISIYHKSEDFLKIIPWIANLELGYVFEINKELPYSFLSDTSVICRVK